MKIVFTSKGKEMDSMMDPRFGRAEYLLMYDEETKQHTVHDNSQSGKAAHGAGPLTAQKVFELKPDVIITGNGPGDKASATLKIADIAMYVGAGNMSISEALTSYQQDKLEKIEL
ncbi:MAG: NifB/NifX family molybdenum-iron cluster-binding protein [Candidatus Marinimicrobia bacterium]|nr:NifB/NifX family molybdenum-iron cluster-binding protein [Candidatus Neomarinimicrobiota bacterium]